MSSVFDVDFASFDTSGDFDERIKLSDLEGSMVVMEPLEYVASIETMHGVTDAVKANIHDVTGGRTYKEQLCFQRAIVAGLKGKIGQFVPGVVGKGVAKPGRSAPWVLHSPTEAQSQAAKDYLAAL